MKSVHTMLAYITVIGFIIRGFWSIAGSPMVQTRLARMLPHFIDTLLLTFGVAMAVQLGLSIQTDWLLAKLLGLLAYIGFGVVTLRASSRRWKTLGFAGALLSVGYIFAVAFSRSATPF